MGGRIAQSRIVGLKHAASMQLCDANAVSALGLGVMQARPWFDGSLANRARHRSPHLDGTPKQSAPVAVAVVITVVKMTAQSNPAEFLGRRIPTIQILDVGAMATGQERYH